MQGTKTKAKAKPAPGQPARQLNSQKVGTLPSREAELHHSLLQMRELMAHMITVIDRLTVAQ